jgi:hypothetical protein
MMVVSDVVAYDSCAGNLVHELGNKMNSESCPNLSKSI